MHIMHRVRWLLAPLVLVALFSIFLTGTASAQTIHTSSVHRSQIAASCSSKELDNKAIYDGDTYLGYTWMVETTCPGQAATVFEETAACCGLTLTMESNINDPYGIESSYWVTTTRIASPTIQYQVGQTIGSGSIQWDGGNWWAYIDE